MPRRGSLASPWWCWARSAGTTTTSGSPGRDTPGQYMPDVVGRIGAAAQEVIGLGARSCSSSRGTFRSGARRSTWACSGATPPRTTTSTVPRVVQRLLQEAQPAAAAAAGRPAPVAEPQRQDHLCRLLRRRHCMQVVQNPRKYGKASVLNKSSSPAGPDRALSDVNLLSFSSMHVYTGWKDRYPCILVGCIFPSRKKNGHRKILTGPERN